MPVFDNDRNGLAGAVERAVHVLATQGPSPSPLARYLALRELAEADLLGPAAGGAPVARLKRLMRRAVLGPQLHFNDRLLAWQRGELLAETMRLAPGRNRRLVYVAPFDVLSRNGGAARVLGLARALGAEFEVNILSVVGVRRSPEIVPVAPGVLLYNVPVTPRFVGHVDADRPALADAALSLGLDRYLDDLPLLSYWYRRLAAGAEICILNQPYLIRLWEANGERPALVYDVPEVNSFFTLRLAAGGSDPDRARTHQAELEKRTCAQASLIGMATAIDRDRLQQEQGAEAGAKVVVIPNGVSVDDGAYLPPGAARPLQRVCDWTRPLAVFLGSPGYPPNVNAVRFIADRLATRFTNVTFAVIGMNERDAGLDTTPPHLVFCGRVSDAVKSAVLGLADFALSPIIAYDSGSSLKIADYVAHGKPVLASEHGLRGFERLASVWPPLALDDFASALEKGLQDLQADAGALDARAGQAREIVREHYDWTALARAYRARMPLQ